MVNAKHISFPLLTTLGTLLTHLTTASPPLTSELASGTEAINPTVTANYQHAFDSFSKEKGFRRDKRRTHDAEFRTWCQQCVNPCACMVAPTPKCEEKLLAKWPGKPELRMGDGVKFGPSPALPLIATEGPSHTTIVRATPKGKAANIVDAIKAKKQEVLNFGNDGESEDKAAVAADAKIDNKPKLGKEVTNTFFTLALSGHHPAVIPLIVSTPRTQDPSGPRSPIILLSSVDTTTFPSYISSSLVADLNLTAEIQPQPLSSGINDNNDNSNRKTLGTLNLDVIAGVQDRLIPDVEFTVYQARSRVSTHHSSHAELDPNKFYSSDIIVGLDFLNQAQALKLSDEYSGEGAGVKEGLGVVVQRVFENLGKETPRLGCDDNDDGERGEGGRHDEL